MGRIINSTFVSIDGVINHMEAWHFDYTDDEADQIASEQLLASDALLMGRHTYEAYAASWPQRDGVYPDKINSIRKYVVSTTLDQADWANTTVIKGDLVPEASKLRQQSGDILMHGFGPVAQTLITNGLLDVLHLWIHPHFAGVGTPSDMLFSEGNNTRLELIGTRTLNSGIVILSYQVPETGRGSAPAAGR
jgi:dihydrofolate reductase